MAFNKTIKYLLTGSLLASAPAFAELAEPVDKNFSGVKAGAVMALGQAQSVGDSTPGAAYLYGAEIYYGMANDTWKRAEFGLELSQGSFSFRRKSADRAKVEGDIGMSAMIKMGYGYSIGNHSFAMWRVGIGPSFIDYKQRANSITGTSPSKTTAMSAMMGLDIVFPASDKLYLLGGLQVRRFNFSIDDVDTSVGTLPIDANFQVNVPLLNVGVSYLLQ